jgi:hypothetical protein
MSAFPTPVLSRLQAVQSALRARKLDRASLLDGRSSDAVAPLAAAELSIALRGGIPRGQLSEIHGPVSSGRTSLAWGALAAATARGEWTALIDTFDRFDPEVATRAGVRLSQLLWVRGQALSKTGGAIDPTWVPGERTVQGPGTLLERTMDRAIKAFNQVALSGVCTMVVLDLIDAPALALARVPRATWLRLQRVVEGSETALVLLAPVPVARSAGGLSIQTGVPDSRPTTSAFAKAPAGWPDSRPATAAVRWKGAHDRTRRLGGLGTRVRATSPRGFVGELPLAIG